MGAERLRAGMLRHRITVRLPVETQNTTTGGWTTTYTTIARRIAALVSPKGGKRLVSGQQVDARTAYAVRLWYRPDLNARHQVIYHAPDGDRILDVMSAIDTDEAHRDLTLECTEGQ